MSNRAMPKFHPDDIRKFWSNVFKKTDDECWPWILSLGNNGYGKVGVKGVTLVAHRVAYYLTHQDPLDLFVCHTCDNPPCCNPNHLFLGTSQENLIDMHQKGRGLQFKIDVNEVFRLYEVMNQREIAEHFGCSRTAISRILLRKDSRNRQT